MPSKGLAADEYMTFYGLCREVQDIAEMRGLQEKKNPNMDPKH